MIRTLLVSTKSLPSMVQPVQSSKQDAQIRRIFLDGYDVLVVRIVIFKISSFKLQNARLLLIFTKYSVITKLFDVIKEFEAEASAGGTMEIVVDPLATGGISESTGGDAPDLEGTLYDISHYMSEVPLDRITEFETAQRQLEAGWENLRVRALFCIERDRVDSLRHHMALSQEEFRQVRRDHDDTRRRLRRLESLVERRLGFRLQLTWVEIHISELLELMLHLPCHDRALMMMMAEEDQVEKFIGGLPDNIQGNVIVVEPTRLQDDVRMANNLMDQKLKGYAMKNAKNKRKFNNSQKDNRGQQPSNKRQNVARAYMAFNNERRVYNGPLPIRNKCKFHHKGPCTMRCGKCNKLRKAIRHYRSDCLKLKDQNLGNKSGNKSGIGEARGKAYVLGCRSKFCVRLIFSTLLDIIPDTFRRLLGHPFNIDLMPVELGSFDIIIDMDWLANHHAVIVCDEKVVRIPYGDEVLIVQGCLIFLAQIIKKETEDKVEEKKLLGMCRCATPVARASYRLAPPELQEFKEEHAEHLKLILELLKKEELYAKFSKCLAGYYRRFNEGFSKIAKPVTKLTQKSVKFEWTEKAEAAFQLLKKKLCSASILALPKGSENFMVYYDASRKGLSAVLMQMEKVIP
ncbi:putative reverse transcriptase domain-containing protein [Tanacetum coccineum]|uniref:Reverse transcriptase domain-containing protein n=1 Tax=Tanacetum coccineum TaxID=301880 RepID=A0ABQ5BL45_9ASTR